MIKNRMDPKNRRILQIRNIVILNIFFFGMLGLFVLGLVLPLRPTVSEVEKRELEKFPVFTWETFVSGEYFSQISDWYADTFPFREPMLSANSKVKGLYGIKNTELYGSVSVADEIPEPGSALNTASAEKRKEQLATVVKATDLSRKTAGPSGTEEVETKEIVAEETTQPSEEEDMDLAAFAEQEAAGSIYIIDKRGYFLYYFNQEGSDLYASVISMAAEQLQGSANVYSMVVPTATSIWLPEKIQEDLKCSSQSKAIEYVYSLMGDNVTKIPVFDTLKEHHNEYLFFYTDHHWTTLGAYYAYVEFAKAKGIEPKSLDDYETMTFDHFIGSLYSSSNQSEKLKNNPDSITAYIPSGTNLMDITTKDGENLKWNVVCDVSGYKDGAKYSCFIGGDNPYSVINNPAITDGSSCLVVKDSYGNALIPFLVDHYQTVHVIDYRSYKGSLVSFVKENHVQDVLFLNNVDLVTVKNSKLILGILN